MSAIMFPNLIWMILFILYGFAISYERTAIDDLAIDLGDKEGLSKTSTISGDNLKKILAGVESGNKDNIFYYGLLKLYGISVSKDFVTARSNFLRASKLGHVEATTAYGVMLMSGTGAAPDYVGAVQFFRKAIDMDDIVSYRLLISIYSHFTMFRMLIGS